MEQIIYCFLSVLVLCCINSITAESHEINSLDEEYARAFFKNYTAQRNKQRAKKWLDTSMEEFRNKCEKNNSLSSFPEIVTAYRSKLEEMFGMNVDPSQEINVHSMDCSNLPDDLADELETVIDALQFCYDETERLNHEEKEKATEIVLGEICLRIEQFAVYRSHDPECQSIVKDLADKCDLATPAAWYSYYSQSIFYMLLMFTVPETDNCNEMIIQMKCYQDAVKHCSKSFRKAIKVLSSPPETTVCYLMTRKQLVNNF